MDRDRERGELEPRADQRHYAASSVERCISIANDPRSLPPHAAATIHGASRAEHVCYLEVGHGERHGETRPKAGVVGRAVGRAAGRVEGRVEEAGWLAGWLPVSLQ